MHEHADWRAIRALGDGECEFRLPNGTPLDLHRDVITDARVRAAFALSTERLLAARRTVVVGGLAVATFGPLDTALHVAVHGCRSGGDRLRWLLDLQQSLLRCGTDAAAELLDRARSFGAELVLRTMLNRVAVFIGSRGFPALPGPSQGQRTWLALDSALMSRYPPGSGRKGRFSGAIMTHSTRATTARSLPSLLTVAPRTLRGRRARPPGS